ncbi:hypothetical protein SDC9_124779 [bioreactor metagenome]|uniref:Uncharacterized protein n=1 Tax=bioreactor metagenome TaxID=1076179 RepID=A0A645CLC7_9ZZZZ
MHTLTQAVAQTMVEVAAVARFGNDCPRYGVQFASFDAGMDRSHRFIMGCQYQIVDFFLVRRWLFTKEERACHITGITFVHGSQIEQHKLVFLEFGVAGDAMGAGCIFTEKYHSCETHFGYASSFQLVFNFCNDFQFSDALAKRFCTYFECFISPIASFLHEGEFLFILDQAHFLKGCADVMAESGCREMFPQCFHTLDSQEILFDGPVRQRRMTRLYAGCQYRPRVLRIHVADHFKFLSSLPCIIFFQRRDKQQGLCILEQNGRQDSLVRIAPV